MLLYFKGVFAVSRPNFQVKSNKFPTLRICNIYQTITNCHKLTKSMSYWSDLPHLVQLQLFCNTKRLSLKINSLLLNNYFGYRNVLKNGVKAIWKLVKKTRVEKKIKILYILDHTIFVHNLPKCGSNTYQTMYGETSDFICIHSLS